MTTPAPRRQREQNSVWLSQIIRGDKSVENETSIQINLCRFSFRACKLKKISNHCTKKMSLLSECTCAYKHEYFMYVKEDRTIDNDMFNKIITSVRTGRCPHALPNKSTSESSVTAKHAFAATGNSDMIMAETTFVPTSCFGITPYHVAAVHKRISAIQKLSNIYNFCTLQYPTKIVENENGVKFDLIATNALKLCIDRDDTLTLKTILGGVTNAYQYNSPILYAIHQGKTNPLEVLLTSYNEYMNIFSLRQEDSFQGTLFAVLSNTPETLAIVLENLNIHTAFILDDNFTLADLARSLGHLKCLEILENWQKLQTANNEHDLSREIKVGGKHNVVSPICTILFKLKFHNLRQFKTVELCNVLEKLVKHGYDINQHGEGGKTALHYVCGPGPFFAIRVHFTLLTLGADINAKDSAGEIPLFHILHDLEIRQFYKKDCLKWFIRMALYHNPVRSNVSHWGALSDLHQFKGLDNIYEGLCEDFLECGFVPKGNTEVRPLQKICRDSLRQAFPGTGLHRLVQETEIPSSFKDFILMTSRFDWKPHLELHK
ncbi:uncharacterized protein LOC123563668 [Mercenaria mercenaria]|uniref:uncharacterized protein LOC123563668 n=1 Tax=Mercenaria mercenaria TaxID=6596 RepID=UPI00234E696E|nr:uncharacterized protein LOC123563668 [Mercenaria mercenaria]